MHKLLITNDLEPNNTSGGLGGVRLELYGFLFVFF